MGLSIDFYGDYGQKKWAGSQKLEYSNTAVKQPLLSFPSSNEKRVLAGNSKPAESPKVKGSVTSDGTKDSEWMRNWFDKRSKTRMDAGSYVGGFDDNFVRSSDSINVSYTNGTRTTTFECGNGEPSHTDTITKRDSKGRPTQIRHTTNNSFENGTTEITYNEEGGQTEETTGFNAISETKEKYVYDKKGNLKYGRVITTYMDTVANRVMGKVGHYLLRTYEHGKWYVQEFDENGKAVSKKMTAKEEGERILARAEQIANNQEPTIEVHPKL